MYTENGRTLGSGTTFSDANLHMHELLRQQSGAAVGRYGERVPLRRDTEEVEVSQARDDTARVQDRLEERQSF